jgi:hypothetical protein
MPETDFPALEPEEPPGSGWSGRSQGIAVLVLVLLFAGALAVFLITDDSDDVAAPTSTSERPTTTVEGRTIPGPESATTSTPPTTAITSSGTVTTAPATTEAPTTGSCGNGAMRVEPEPGAITFEQGRYQMPLAAVVVSQYDRSVEVTRLVLRVTFEDGTTTDVELDITGVVIPPGDRHTYSGPTIDSASEPVTIEVFEFAYQAEGRPDCTVSG